MIRTFKDYKVWQKGHEFVISIYTTTTDFPDYEQFSLTCQMRRASISVCANIAEGYKKSTRDFKRYLHISQGSLEEVKYYLILAYDLRYLEIDKFTELNERADEIGKMLEGLSRKL